MRDLVGFDKARTEELLAELDRRLRARGAAASIYLVCGAAIALSVRDSRRTQDLASISTWVADVLRKQPR